jgi:hypothetical protein
MNVQKLAAWTSAVAVSAAVIAGFVLSGTPMAQRLERLDARRQSDLQQLAVELNVYWRAQGALPEDIQRVVDGRRMSRLPTDPVSGLPYPYQRLSAEAYRLCASFERASEPWEPQDFWNHPAGEHCYEFETTREAGPTYPPGR